MAKQTVTIDVDVPDGFEVTGEYRPADFTESFIDGSGKARSPQPNQMPFTTLQSVFILRPIWQPPPWLKPGSWLWSNGGKIWCASSLEPMWGGSGWAARNTCYSTFIMDDDSSIIFNPPPWTDAKSSLRQIGGAT